jgi:hypothetical protein
VKANLARLIGFTALLLLMQFVADHYAKVFLNINWLVIMTAEAVLFVVFGAVAFRLYVGGRWMRIAFTVAIPVLANSIQEVVTGSDPAYPYLLVALIIPYGIAFGVGAGLMALIHREATGRRD